MEGIRFIGMSICVTAAVTALFSMLVPRMDRMLKFSISLFFLTSLAAPFVGKSGSLRLDFPDFYSHLPTSSGQRLSLENAVETELSGLAARKISASVERLLCREGYTPKKVETVIHINGNTGISINQMRILLESGDQAREVCEIVQREAGITPEIWTEGD